MIILCHTMLPTYTSSKTCVILKVQLKWLLLKFPLLYLLFSYACSLSFSPSLFIFTNFNLTLFLSGFSLFSFLSHSMSLYMCSVFMSHTHSLTHSLFLSFFLAWNPKTFQHECTHWYAKFDIANSNKIFSAPEKQLEATFKAFYYPGPFLAETGDHVFLPS